MADRNTAYQFVDTDSANLESILIQTYQVMTGTTVQPGSPERQFIQWVAYIFTLVLNDINYAGNQNIPSRAEGENLDALAELYYMQSRPTAQPATCQVKFTISEEQDSPVLIPSGTRVTDGDQTLVWATDRDWYINEGTEITVPVTCQTVGVAGNGYAIGQINQCVDVFEYYTECSNTTISDGGSDVPTDEEFYELMRSSMDAWSTAGPVGAYLYHAKRASTEIADVVANSPVPGEVRIYVLTESGEKASEELKKHVLDTCNADDTRPLTDKVLVEDPKEHEYNIRLTYYLPSDAQDSSNAIQAAVDEAVNTFVAWQCGKLGRDINPSRLIQEIMATGVKRVDVEEPAFAVLKDGKLEHGTDYSQRLDETIPEIAKLSEKTVTNGGFEDE